MQESPARARGAGSAQQPRPRACRISELPADGIPGKEKNLLVPTCDPVRHMQLSAVQMAWPRCLIVAGVVIFINVDIIIYIYLCSIHAMPSCSCAFAPGTRYEFGSTSMAMLMKLWEGLSLTSLCRHICVSNGRAATALGQKLGGMRGVRSVSGIQLVSSFFTEVKIQPQSGSCVSVCLWKCAGRGTRTRAEKSDFCMLSVVLGTAQTS